MAHLNGNQFRPEEIICLRHYDKKTGIWSESEFPKVGGRLRLAHEVNGSLDINTDIVQYDGKLAVVRAVISSDKGSFSGIGMASVERDAKIAPAILELAETINKLLKRLNLDESSMKSINELRVQAGNITI